MVTAVWRCVVCGATGMWQHQKGTPFSEEWFESLTPAALATEYEEIPSVESQTERRYIGPHDYYPVEDPLLSTK